MQVRQLEIRNFRGISKGRVSFNGNTLLVGGNNVGKSTVCEALDLVLGPDRTFRHPVVDEHDFSYGQYLDQSDNPLEIRIDVVVVDLTDEAQRRFRRHLRRWDDVEGEFVDTGPGGAARADEDDVVWALPIVFLGRYDPNEDDFVGDTFFNHPIPSTDDLDDDQIMELGQGRSQFTRSHKRLCGFIFLRTLRTGSRALSLQRGSLLDTILKLGGEGATAMWRETLSTLRCLDPAIGDIEQLESIRAGIQERLAMFVNLASSDDSAAFFASDLTREHVREVVRLFIATKPSEHLVPYSRQGTGSINLLVFALLTLIADLKGKHSVIFAMEEPEIALPPHTQRRVTRFVLNEMGQSIVTSHSPYVIEQFEPENIVILDRDQEGGLVARPIDIRDIKRKAYRTERRQFAEAILSKAVLVVEGSTEAAVFVAASSALERFVPAQYMHFDLAGVTVFVADGEGDVPRYGPIFKALGKQSFAVVDKPNQPLGDEALKLLGKYDEYRISPEKGIERLIVDQTPVPVLRRFLDDVSTRSDYPNRAAPYSRDIADGSVREIAFKVLKDRKGEAWAYAAMVIEHCDAEDELPPFIFEILIAINKALLIQVDGTLGAIGGRVANGPSRQGQE